MSRPVTVGSLDAIWYRTYAGSAAAPYLVTIAPGSLGSLGGCPQARAVVDDFGCLVIVTGWH